MDLPSNGIILKQKLSSNTFKVAMRFSMKLVQCYSYFPIDLGSENGTTPLEFRWLYWRTGYCLITFILFLVEITFVTAHVIRMQFNFLNIRYFIFQLSGLVQLIFFFKLTYQWPKFVREWNKVEVNMRNYKMHSSLRLKLNFMTTIFMLSALVEHSLVNAYKLKNSIDLQPNISSAFENYFVQTYQYIFENVSYSFWIGVVIQRTLSWAFADVFIMLIGTALTYRLRQMSMRIESISKMKASLLTSYVTLELEAAPLEPKNGERLFLVNNKTQWKVLRQDYIRLTELCQAINSRISSIIIVCFLTNLYLVLLQLFLSMQLTDNIMQKIYFYMSFALILIRFVGVCIFGGAVYEEWKNMGFCLNCVVTSAYNQEVERMTCHVHSWELSLSGKNFFNVSRGLILKIAGAIVTYELVLIQFYNNSQ